MEAWRYLADSSEAAADRFFDKLESVLTMLADNPHAGRSRNEVSQGLRSFPVGSFILYYRVTQSSIVLTRVVSAYRDVDTIEVD